MSDETLADGNLAAERITCPGCGAEIHRDASFDAKAFACPSCCGALHFDTANTVLMPSDSANTVPMTSAALAPIQTLLQDQTMLMDATATGPLAIRSVGEERYAIGSELARGGMGAVLNAKDLNLRRDVAMKVVLDPSRVRPDQLVRFVHEAQVTGQLEHPSIVPVYELGQDATGKVYYTMKFIRGLNLGDILKALREGDAQAIGKYPLPRLLAIFIKACDALAFAHSRGVIHRDLKPDNIMVGDFGEVLIVDWGLAKVLGTANAERGMSERSGARELAGGRTIESVRDSKAAAGTKTMDGTVMGTPAYMAPEQAEGDIEHRGPPADIYAMGAILYAILTLEAPFEGDSVNAILAKVLNGDFVAPDQHRGALSHCVSGAVPSSLSAVVTKAMATAPKDRYGSVQALQKDVQAYLDGFATSAEEAGLWRLTKLFIARHRAISLVALVAVVLLMILSIGGPVVAARQSRLAHEARVAEAVAQEQRAVADAATQKAQRILVDMETSRGIDAAADGDHGGALLWFTEAAQQSTLDPARRAANLIRARNAVREAPIAVGWVKVHHAVEEMRFLQGGAFLMIRDSHRLTIKDWQSIERPNHLELKCSAVGTSPDEMTLAVGAGTDPVQFYELPSTTPFRTLKVDGNVKAITCSPNGRYWAFAIGRHIRVWDRSDDKWAEGAFNTSDKVYELTFSPDGSKLAVADSQGQAWVLRFEKERLHETPLLGPVTHLFTKQVQGARVTGPIFVERGRALVCIESWESLSRYELGAAPGSPALSIPVQNPYKSTGLIASPNADGFAVIAHHFLQFHDGKGEQLKHIRSHRLQILDASVSGNSKLLFTASWDSSAQLQDFETGAVIGGPFVHDTIVRRCAMSSDGELLATATRPSDIRIWRRQESLAPLRVVSSWGMVPRLSPDGTRMAPGMWHLDSYNPKVQEVGQVRVLDTFTGREMGPPIELDGCLVDSCVASDNRTVAVAWQSGDTNNPTASFGLFDVSTGKAIAPAMELPGDPRSVAVHPRDPQLAVLHAGGVLAVDGATGRPLWHRKDIAKPWSNHEVRYTPDGNALVAAEADFVHVLRASDGKSLCLPIKSVPERTNIRTFAIAPDSRHLAVATLSPDASYLQVWDMETGEPVSERVVVPGTWTAVGGLAFSPDGSILAVGGSAGEIRCWNWREWTLHCPPLRHEKEVSGFCFSPDGALISATGATLNFWDLHTGKALARPLPSGGAWPSSLSVACTPDGKRILCANGRWFTTWVVNAAELLGPPELDVETYRLLAECGTGARIALGDQSLLSDKEWQQRFLKLRESWQWTPYFEDPGYWSRKLAAHAFPRDQLQEARRAARHPGMLDAALELQPDCSGAQLARAERSHREGDAAAADRHGRRAAELLLPQLQGAMNDPNRARAVAAVLRDNEFPNDLDHFREAWPLIKQVDANMYNAILARRTRTAERKASDGDLAGARTLYTQLAAVVPENPLWQERLDGLPASPAPSRETPR